MATDQSQGAQATAVSSQDAFKSSPWEDSSWEIVGESPRGAEFFPMQVTPIVGAEATIDPMFADFGGRVEDSKISRWHLPGDLAGQYSGKQSKAEDSPGTVKVTEEELKALKSAAFEQGRLEGAKGEQAQSDAKVKASLESITTLVQDLHHQLEESTTLIVRQSVDLAVAMAKKIIDGAVEINPEYIGSIIRDALPLAGGAPVRRVRVSPQDMEFIEIIGVQKIFNEFDQSWVFEGDPTIRAGCIVETSSGEIDFDLDHAFERLRDKIISVSKV